MSGTYATTTSASVVLGVELAGQEDSIAPVGDKDRSHELEASSCFRVRWTLQASLLREIHAAHDHSFDAARDTSAAGTAISTGTGFSHARTPAMSLHGDDSSDDGAEIVVGTQADRLKRPAEDEASAGGYVGGTEADGDADDDGDMSMEIDGGVGTRPESGSITPGYASTPTAGSTTRSGARHGLHVNMTSKRPAASAAATQTPLSFTIDDPEGDEKIDSEGNLLGGRQFLCKTFFLPEKDQTLYLLATEVARITGYRDSYLLFHKNKHLFKLMTNDAEKQMMIAQEA